MLQEELIQAKLEEIKNAISDMEDKVKSTRVAVPEADANAKGGAAAVVTALTRETVWVELSKARASKPDAAAETQDEAQPGPSTAHPDFEKIDPDGKLEGFQNMAKNLVARYVRTILEPQSSAAMAQALSDSPVGQVRGNTAERPGYVCIIYDCKLSGETATHPHLRVPGLRDNLSKLVGGVLLSRVPSGATVTEIDGGDCYLLFDGFKHGNEAALHAPFKTVGGKALPYKKTAMYVQYDEDSVSKRKSLVRGGLDCLEFMHVVSAGQLHTTGIDRPRLHYAGTTRSNVIGPVAVQPHDQMTRTTFANKKKLMGPARFEVGGKTEGLGVKPVKREPEDMEPLAYHGNPPEFYESLGHTFDVAAWIDLTALDLCLASVAVHTRTPYFGVCCTEAHQSFFQEKLSEMIFSEMANPTSPHFQSELQQIIAQIGKDAPKPKPKSKPKPKADPSGRGSGRGRGRGMGRGRAGGDNEKSKLRAQLKALQGGQEGEDDEEEPEEEEPEEEEPEEEGE